MTSCAKCRINKNEGLVGCEASCNCWYHYSCIGLTNVEFTMLSKSKNLFYMCDNCKHKCDIVVKSSVQDYNNNIKSINERVTEVSKTVRKTLDTQLGGFSKLLDDLKENLLKSIKSDVEIAITEHLNKFTSQWTESCPSKTYASAASSSNASLLVTPKVTQKSSTTKSDMLQNINPIDVNINLTQVKQVRDGGLLISCANDNECTKFKEVAADKLSNKYVIKEVSALNPRLKIVGISEKLDNDVLLNYIQTQNKCVFSDDSVCKIIANVPLKKNKNIYQVTIQTDKVTYKSIMEQGKLFVGYDYCNVFDAIDIRRCYKCCGFHHLSNKCLSKVTICPRCAEHHAVADCKSDVLRCINCINFKKGNKDVVIDVNHASWDTCCHVYSNTLKKFKNNILGSQ